jgi:2-polyprenyl-3-methyl-5-hydroxy-6-metoxy-1,4-benzoquinol methylase
MKTVFDRARSSAINKARQDRIKGVLNELRTVSPIKTAVDLGCGVGIFSKFLTDLGMEVVGVEGRLENITEAQRRYPTIKFNQWDVEDPAIANLGLFDLVLCTGLLYHLENPFRALRNIAKLVGQFIIVESVVHPDKRPIAVLADECDEADQGLNHVALIPSESALMRMFMHSGLEYLYRVRPQPEFDEFRGTLLRKKQRTMLVGSRTPLEVTILQPVRVTGERYDPWERSRVITSALRLVRGVLRPLRGHRTRG